MICPITYICLLKGHFNYGVDGGKFMCMIMLREEVRVLIIYLAMFGGV